MQGNYVLSFNRLESWLTNPPGHFGRDKWTTSSGPISEGVNFKERGVCREGVDFEVGGVAAHARFVERDHRVVFLQKGIQTPMAQGRSTEIITMIKWIRTSRLSIKELSLSRFPASNGTPVRGFASGQMLFFFFFITFKPIVD